MLDALGSAFMQVFSWPTFGYMLIGVSLGFAVGILPGIGGGVTLALMLPFIYKMDPLPAFAFLLGMLSVTATTGDITSVLFGIPGEAISAATVVDGHPMAKKGQAGRALGAVLMSSLVGAIVGSVALVAAIPIVRPLVLSFGSPEFFMLTLLGITFVASLSGRDPLKGLLAGGLGLMLAMVGMSTTTGIARYTFGELSLWEGVGLVPVTAGLFAIPEIIDLGVRGTGISARQIGKLGGVLEGVKDTFRHFWLTIRCSLIGTFFGLIPGLGGSVSQWLAYGHAVQSSSNKALFGSGDVRGVLGPGAANNSKEGGNLITAVAFGIPGSVGMAVLLGAFIAKGIIPGPNMLTTHLDLTLAMAWTMAVSNLIAVGISFLFLNQIAKVTTVRGSLLIPILLTLIFVGGFTERNQLFDVGVTLGAGLVGWIMERFEWPRAPLILGLVVGSLGENYFFLSVARYGSGWLTRPLVLVIGCAALLALTWPAVQRRLTQRKGAVKHAGAPGI